MSASSSPPARAKSSSSISSADMAREVAGENACGFVIYMGGRRKDAVARPMVRKKARIRGEDERESSEDGERCFLMEVHGPIRVPL
jgi:hypothetical protein